jgi:hypothetical protein
VTLEIKKSCLSGPDIGIFSCISRVGNPATNRCRRVINIAIADIAPEIQGETVVDIDVFQTGGVGGDVPGGDGGEFSLGVVAEGCDSRVVGFSVGFDWRNGL